MFDKKMIVSIVTAIVLSAIILHVLGYLAMKMGLGPMKHRDDYRMKSEKHMMMEGDKMDGDAMMMEAEVEVQ